MKLFVCGYYSTATYQFANPVQHQINDFLADGVVTTSVVVSSIFLSCDELLGVEQLTVSSRANLIWTDHKHIDLSDVIS